MKFFENKFDNVKHEEEKILNKILQEEDCYKETLESRRNELKNYREITRKLETSSIVEKEEELKEMKEHGLENLSYYGRIYYYCLETELEERRKLLCGTIILDILDKYKMILHPIEENDFLNETNMIKDISSIDCFRYKVRNWFRKVKELEEYLRDEHDFDAGKFFGHSEYQIYNDKKNVMLALAIINELQNCKKKLNNGCLNNGTVYILAIVVELLDQLKYYSKRNICKDKCTIEDYLSKIISSFNEIMVENGDANLKEAVLSIVSEVYYA